MKCPYCKSTDIASKGIVLTDDGFLWRKKKCYMCEGTFHTVEVVTTDNPIKDKPNMDWLNDKFKDWSND